MRGLVAATAGMVLSDGTPLSVSLKQSLRDTAWVASEPTQVASLQSKRRRPQRGQRHGHRKPRRLVTF